LTLVLAVPATLAVEEKAKNYTFRTPPANSQGMKSLADLRGKPVLIDFWGTR
jgi:hypothetical protein